jgi:threonine dehydrogenase-like Zn-dependent dehydrogenase
MSAATTTSAPSAVGSGRALPVRTTLLDDANDVGLAEVMLPTEGRGPLVRVLYGGICGTDLHLLAGHDAKSRPISLGHEFVGEVIELPTTPHTMDGGAVAVGDRILVEPGFSCGRCDYCIRHGALDNLCTARRCHGLEVLDGSTDPVLGGFSDHVRLAPGVSVQRIPESISTRRATLAEPLSVAIRAAERALVAPRPDINLGPGLGAEVAVVGLGPIGLLVALVLQRLGASVLGIERHPDRRALAAEVGIATVAGEHAVDAVDERTAGRGADVVVECGGESSAFLLSFDLVRRGGRIVELGHFFPIGTVDFDPQVVCANDLEVVGTALGPGVAYPKAAWLLTDERTAWDALITDEFALDDVKDAFALAGERKAGKVIVGPGR